MISNGLLIPLLPKISKIRDVNEKRGELVKTISKAVIISTASMIILGSLFIILSTELVHLIFQRGAFNSKASELVAGLLIAYGLGMPAYLGRDLLVRIFYALGDGNTPFRVSLLGILINILFDWILIGGPSPWGDQMPFNFGVNGLVFATTCVNIISCIILLINLKALIKGLNIKALLKKIIKLILSGLASGFTTLIISNYINWPNNISGLIFHISLSTLFSISTFIMVCRWMKIQEINEIGNLLRYKSL